jgi:hypothetical protein
MAGEVDDVVEDLAHRPLDAGNSVCPNHSLALLRPEPSGISRDGPV